MILNPSQAEATYSAMCALNNVSIHSGLQLAFVGRGEGGEGDYQRIGIHEDAGGEVMVYRGAGLLGRERESYVNQAAFATAYNLQ